MYLWAVWHDRPMCWAANRANYSSLFRPRHLPSRSQFCRRIQSDRCQTLLAAVNRHLSSADDVGPLRYLDGRALVVGPHSADVDAKRGPRGRGYAKGYKLHAITTQDGRFVDFRVASLNVSEKRVAETMLEHTPSGGLLLADAGYDSGRLYDKAQQHGIVLLTPLPKNAGGGHRPQSSARMFAKRLWALGVKHLYAKRNNIERYFGQLSAFGGGLTALPPWVRTLSRVRRWVTAKITIYHAKLRQQAVAK